MKKRKSYQKWSWIFMVLFIALSIYNVKFGLLGFICIGAPLFFVLKKQGKVHCSHYCPRGSLLQNFLRHISLQNNLPNKFKTKIVKNIILIFMLIMFITTIISSGGNIKLLGFGLFRIMTSSLILGIILGITLVSPQLLNAYSVATATKIPFWDFGFAQVNMIGYQAQVIPAILAGFVLVYLEKFFRRISPDAISMIVVPFCSLVPAVLIAHTIVGPIGWVIGDFIFNIVYSGLTFSFGVLFAAAFGLVYAPLVITGLHHMTNAIDMQLVNQFGGTIL